MLLNFAGTQNGNLQDLCKENSRQKKAKGPHALALANEHYQKECELMEHFCRLNYRKYSVSKLREKKQLI